MKLEIKFANPQQREFYYSRARNQTFSGGFNNGKSYAGCLKAFTLLTTFPNYRMVIARQVFADLKKTTMQTFFKICPRDLIERHNEQDGLTMLKNRSTIHWLHLDNVDESTLRGLEVNSVLVDQAEEIEEKVYDVLDARIGRWDEAEIPEKLRRSHEKTFGPWPLSAQNKLIAPSYMMLLCNPDTQYHFIYRKYHPQSLERNKRYFFVEGQWDSTLGSQESYENALERGEEWVEKYVMGKWGISKAQIHRLPESSQLDYSPELIDKIKKHGNLFRIMDHGETSPTSCLWCAALDGIYIFYREYYMPNTVISKHRQNIFDLSEGESYSANYADPQIFKKTTQKDGGFWTVADEYLTRDLEAPPLAWIAADNNEFATRNRINELLRSSAKFTHPITGIAPAPGIYFIKKSDDYSQGCFHAISEIQSQRRKLLAYLDGSAVYCDDREESIADHAYDCIRYFVAMHGNSKALPEKKAPKNSFKWFKLMEGRRKNILAAASS